MVYWYTSGRVCILFSMGICHAHHAVLSIYPPRESSILPLYGKIRHGENPYQYPEVKQLKCLSILVLIQED